MSFIPFSSQWVLHLFYPVNDSLINSLERVCQSHTKEEKNVSLMGFNIQFMLSQLGFTLVHSFISDPIQPMRTELGSDCKFEGM
ncbi:hypothetical protein PanWU01x14_265900 [Parasponia andersonii]|uniref:Uncharacterized protein n=1 Tax=Parasponia andersonii TaxID=3476 RepID=A0A2P5B763_PARAD|nr:hypothetical protein PanWU01x14_265900 [Parasponia andersonii]